jgi:hypothetical protein
MTDPAIARAFLTGEVGALEPFDLVAVVPDGNPLHLVEITRGEEGELEVRVPGRPPFAPELPAAVRSRLRERGFRSKDPADRSEPWARRVEGAEQAVEVAQQVLTEVLEQKPDARLDIAHGNRRAEHEARLKLAEIRETIQATLIDMAGGPVEKDADGDYVVPLEDVHVMVAPRLLPDGTPVVRVFSITNVGITVAPELGLFLARLNFGLMFGRFALDAEHASIWFDESLLGNQLTDEQLRFTVKVVASTADQWDDRLKQMFGGATYQEVLKKRAGGTEPLTKPGQGGYL